MSGDKLIMGNTMKSTIGAVIPAPEVEVRPLFSDDAIDARLTTEQVLAMYKQFAPDFLRRARRQALIDVQLMHGYAVERMRENPAVEQSPELLDMLAKVVCRDIFTEAVMELLDKPVGELLDIETADLQVLSSNRSVNYLLAVLANNAEPEPPVAGDTSMGLNTAWLDWFMTTFNVKAWIAIKEGKRRLRELGLARKRSRMKPRSTNPK